MKRTFIAVLAPIGILFAAGCGARTPLGDFGDQGTTLTTGSGGSVGSAGILGSGGHGSGGAIVGAGGSIYGTGGATKTPLTGSGGYVGSGGHIGSGGTIASGGTTGLTTKDGGITTDAARGGSAGTSVGGSTSTGGMVGAGGLTATGGLTGAGGTVGSGGTTCQGLAANEELIDDLNDGDRFIPTVNGRSGAWTDSHDSSPNGKMSPDPSTSFVPTQTGDACRKYAAYVSGNGYVIWGSDFWFGLGSPYNASKYTGISFWAKVDANTSSVIRVAFPDKDTQPDGNICQTSSTSSSTGCYDHFGQRITLTTTWTKYTISFSKLTQDGWGLLAASFDPSSLYEVLFQIPVNATFGVWIDDVAFTM